MKWSRGRIVGLAIFIAAVSVFARSVYVPVDSIKGPVCVISDTALGRAATLSPSRSTYNVIVTDGLAQVTLFQMFVNDFGKIDDIAYIFPLPDDASVHAMEMKYRDSIYTAKIFEKAQAQTIYDSVVAAGGTAAMLLQSRPNVFVQHLANIAEGDTARIKIKLTMPLKFNNGAYELSIPTMVAERYQSQGADPVGSSGRLWNPSPDRNGQTLQINVLLQTGFPITDLQSPTHPLSVSQISDVKPVLIERGVIDEAVVLDMPYGAGALLQQVATYPNKDFVLRFSRSQATQDFSVASCFDADQMPAGYFFCTIFPDTGLLGAKERSPMEIVLLIDISGSQSGWPIRKEKEIASMILDRLRTTDRFTLLSFNTTVTWCFENGASVPVTPENLTKAKTFVSGLSASGGTNLLAGVQAALSSETVGELDRYFIFLTDGFISNESAIFDAIRTHPSHPTVFTFGAGNNLNRYFLEESARVGNGYASEVTENESVELFVNDAWNKMESPQLQDLTIGFSGSVPENVLMPLGNRLYRGCPVVIYGTYSAGGSRTVTISGHRDGETVTFSREITLAVQSNANSMIPQVWARQMIRQMRIEEGSATTNKARIIELSLAYQVLSDYTAFLAYEPAAEMDAYGIVSQANTSRGVDSSGYRIIMPIENERVTGKDIISRDITIRLFNNILTILSGKGNWIREILVYDLQGRCIYRLRRIPANCTSFRWDGCRISGGRIPAGRYLIRIRTTTAVTTRMAVWQ
ncbi:MAG: VWA domain-containing protein [Chitinispirillaceae bacterium]|nr:VWA domain-containing protein [Chitinispirillaceae bacterium]